MTGIERIAAERKRQLEVEGWDAEHDKQHDKGELALVASLYAAPRPLFANAKREDGGMVYYDPWPWFREIEETRYADDNSTYEHMTEQVIKAACKAITGHFHYY